MSALVVPDPTRVVRPPRLQRFGSAEDMRKEPSLQSPYNTQTAVALTPSPPAPQRQISRPHGLVPSLTSLLLSAVHQGILNQSYKSLDLNSELLTELLLRLQSKRQLCDDNLALFSPLQELYLNGCPISDKGIRALLVKPESRSIIGLHLENTNVTDESLRLIAQRCRELRVLDVSKCLHVTEQGVLAVIEKCPDLRYLGLKHMHAVSDAVLLAAFQLPQLMRLDIDEAGRVSDHAVRRLYNAYTAAPRLLPLRAQKETPDSNSSFFGSYMTRVGDTNLSHGSAAPSSQVIIPAQLALPVYMSPTPIEELSLSATMLSAPAIPALAAMCPRLASLNLSYCPQVSDTVIANIMDHCPQLQTMTLRSAHGITDASLPRFHKLSTLYLFENPRLSLPAIRKLVLDQNSTVQVIGADLDITFLRNSPSKTPFTLTVNEFEPAAKVLQRIDSKLAEESFTVSSSQLVAHPMAALTSTSINRSKEDEEESDIASSVPYKLRRVTYRKNGTKRPGIAHPESDFGHLIREVVEKKHHLYLDQTPNSTIRLAPGAGGMHVGSDIFLTLRVWDAENNCPKDLRDVTISSSVTLSELKEGLAAEGALPCPPECMFIAEEETDLRTNILASDTMSISMCGIISGDVLHFEEITDDKLDLATQQIVKSSTGAYLSSRPVAISIQETDDSFHRRRGRLTFLADNAYKFDLKLKSTWSFSKLKMRIARHVGVAPEYLRISTRVEPQVHLQATTMNQSAVEVIGGNLWLLLEIDCTEMLAEKIPVVVHYFARAKPRSTRNSASSPRSLQSEASSSASPSMSAIYTSGAVTCQSIQTILVRKNATLKNLKEMIQESLHIPEELQLISRISSRDLATATIVAATSSQTSNLMPTTTVNSAANTSPVSLAASSLCFVRQVYLQDSAKLSQLNLHHIRIDEMERPITSNDLILQTVQFGGWRTTRTFKTFANPLGPVQLIAIPATSKFNDVKAAIAANNATPDSIDVDTMTLKLAGSATLQKTLMFDIKPKYFSDHSPVIASTLMRSLDIICWSDSEF